MVTPILYTNIKSMVDWAEAMSNLARGAGNAAGPIIANKMRSETVVREKDPKPAENPKDTVALASKKEPPKPKP